MNRQKLIVIISFISLSCSFYYLLQSSQNKVHTSQEQKKEVQKMTCKLLGKKLIADKCI